MKVIDPNYVPPKNEFKTFPDGDYQFKGFEWISTSNNRPCLKAQKDGRMTGRLKWHFVDGKEGPYQGLDLAEMAMLRKVVGLPQSRVPAEHEAGAIASFMEELQKAAQDKVVEAKVSKGWVNLKGMEIPIGYYRFYLSKIGPLKNGVPTPQSGEFGLYFFAEFTIDSGEGGSSTPFKGAVFTETVPYAIEVVDGEPQWKLKDGAPSGEATRLSMLMRLTAPQWVSNDMPHKDAYNLLPEFSAEALRSRKLLKSARGENKNKRIAMLWPTLEAVHDYQEVPYQPAIQPQQNGNSELKTAKDVLTHVLNTIAGKPAIVDLSLTQAGKELALKYFKPLKEQGKIQNTAYAMLTDEEILEILDFINAENRLQFADEYAKATSIVKGEFTIINDPTAGPAPWEQEENPFK